MDLHIISLLCVVVSMPAFAQMSQTSAPNASTSHWYLYTRHDSANFDFIAGSRDTRLIGGYQYALPNQLHWFIETGFKPLEDGQLSDIASRHGMNLSTGLRYQLSSEVELSGMFNQQNTSDEQHHSTVSMNFEGAYKLNTQLALKARYQVYPDNTPLSENSLAFDLNYNF
ncbi:outer membrane beta-barrel protein [Celerinatantimonas diazotrophica]|uniref:Outer membrane protein with beta-barrel domain n=1 Tax=Celerinatantimonas diazotrophica TaxID=412034 RepID=A0A4R1K209_9GAMM|nr:outer membrane beta-barrel protein [Celerinatantimonas diazotrophica]TCK58035.1 hypothetical protein EV690_1740 [Celerinatantimonas diazotrophica]CAG9297896.1 hypothetical protein CEDIAZO_03088 [Celerinatantimonas diazotrophica]